MQDARIFTDYRPNCVLTNSLQQKAGIKDSNEFRKYLQQNALNIIKSNKDCIPLKNCELCPVCKNVLQYK